MKNHYLEKVQEFHTQFNVFRHKFVEDVQNSTALNRAAFISEEFREYHNAPDNTERLDALCDLMYVVVGTMDVLHLFPTPVHPVPTMESAIGNLLIELNKSTLCRNGLNRTLAESQTTIETRGNILGAFTKAFDEVHRTNMAKAWTGEQVAANIEPIYMFNGVEVNIDVCDLKCIVTRRDNNKIIKPPGWAKPNLSQFLNAVHK